MLGCFSVSPPGAARAIAGGFVLIPARQLFDVWHICRARPLGTPDFRTYLACREVAARRQLLGEGRAPSFTFAELARLLDIAERRARASVARLVAAGLLEWSASAIAFPKLLGDYNDDRLADTIGSGRGDLAVPRRLLRHLAGGARPALVAASLGFLLRCLSRRKPGFDGRGRAKASWIARAFGVDIRAVKDARKELIALGWIAPEPSPQAVENRWGRAYRIDLDWAGLPDPAGKAVAAGCRESPPPTAPACRESPPPLINQDPLREGFRNQDPAPAGPAGINIARTTREGEATPTASFSLTKAELPPPQLAAVRSEDLSDATRMLELHRQAMVRGLVGPSEADRLKFCAVAEHARVVGTINPGGLFAVLVRRGWWHYATQGDEDAASARLKRHLHGDRKGGVVLLPVVGTRPASPGRVAASADAALAREVLTALVRVGARSDPFPLVCAKDPSWTRERWDRALAELGGGVPGGDWRWTGDDPAALWVESWPIRDRPGDPWSGDRAEETTLE
jgi:hypothetical protein